MTEFRHPAGDPGCGCPPWPGRAKESEMTIERAYGKVAFVCDDCETESDTQSGEDFDILLNDLKEAGWRVVKEGGEWCHYCPNCG